MKIVIDSNVWISALVFGGNPRRIFERVVSDGWTIITSEEIFTEVRRILNVKFPEFVDDFEAFQAILRRQTTKVRLGSSKVAVCRDQDDDNVVETALIGDADFIITDDKDLLTLAEYKNIQIVMPADFLHSIEDNE